MLSRCITAALVECRMTGIRVRDVGHTLSYTVYRREILARVDRPISRPLSG